MFVESSNTIINRVSAVGIIGNILLSLFKFVAGIVGNSSAMVSDAVHSTSDIVATIVAYFGAKFGHKGNDEDHPYGHERIECIFTLFLGLILLGTGLVIGYEAIVKIATDSYGEEPKMIAVVAAVVSIVTKELMFHYTMHYAKVLRSDSFRADAWHHRSDALSSIAALIGIALAMSGFPIMDPIASIIICLFIIKVSAGILLDSINKTVDKSCDCETVESMKAMIMGIEGVRSVDLINTRLFGNYIYVDLEISVDCDMTVEEGHRIAEDVHLTLEQGFPEVKHVMVHVNPYHPSDCSDKPE